MGKSYTFLVVSIKGVDSTSGASNKSNFLQEKIFIRSNCPYKVDVRKQEQMELTSKLLTDTYSETNLIMESRHMDVKFETPKTYACRSFQNNLPSFHHSTPTHSNLSAKQTHFMTSDISVSENGDCSAEQCKFYLISSTTKFTILSGVGLHSSGLENAKPLETFETINGIEEKITKLRNVIRRTLKDKRFPQYSGYQSCGALLYGPSGSGKTVIAKCIGSENDCYFKSLSAALILTSYYEDSQTALKFIFTDAIQRAPSIIFIDDVHILFPSSPDSGSTLETKLSYDLASHLENLKQYFQPVYVLMATNKSSIVSLIMAQLKGLIEDVEISLPTCSQREEILQKLLSNLTSSITSEDMKNIATSTPGFVASDVCSLCQLAEIEAHNGCGLQMKCDTNSDQNVVKPIGMVNVHLQDIVAALNRVKPNGLRELAVEVPEVHWSDIGGQEEIKHRLHYAVEIPLKNPEFFSFYGVNPPSGMLLYGPPGCSKTLIAKAVSTESKINFIAIKGHDLLSKWVGESERALKEVYHKARAASPCIVFLDEIDALTPERESETNQMMNRLLTQLLIEIDGTCSSKNVFTLAATNRPDRIDKALLRPGRLNHLIYVPLPDEATRRKIVEIKFRKMSITSSVNIDTLVKKTENYSGAEIVGVCDEAAYLAFADEHESKLPKIQWHHFECALETITPRTPDFLIELYKAFSKVN